MKLSCVDCRRWALPGKVYRLAAQPSGRDGPGASCSPAGGVREAARRWSAMGRLGCHG